MIKINLFNFIPVLIIITLLYTFMLGFHTSDTCQNLKFVNTILENKGIQFHETSLKSDYMDANECYSTGIFMQIMSFFILMILTIIILFTRNLK
jgi:hypothetical protein